MSECPQAEINRRRGSAWTRRAGKSAVQWSECPACEGAGSLWFSPTREVRTMADPRPIMDDCELIACPWCEGEGKVPVAEPLRTEGLDGSKPIEIGPDGFVRQAVSGKPDGDGWEMVEDASPTITAPDGTEHYDFVHKGVRYQGPLMRDARLDGIRGVWVRSAPDT